MPTRASLQAAIARLVTAGILSEGSGAMWSGAGFAGRPSEWRDTGLDDVALSALDWFVAHGAQGLQGEATAHGGLKPGHAHGAGRSYPLPPRVIPEVPLAPGTGFPFRVYICLGSGAYICDEEVAPLESVEGRRSRTLGAGADALQWSWTYGYAGEVLTTNYPTGLGISQGVFGYDAAGRMNRIQYFQGQTLLADDTLSYDGFRVTGRSDAVAGIDVGFRYDSFGRLDQVEWSQMVGGTPNILDGQERSFDIGDHVVGRKRSLDSLGEVFVHDGYGRMKAWYQGVPNALGQTANAVPSGWTTSEEYTLDAVYTRSQVVHATNGAGSTPHSYSSDAAHFYTDVDGETRTQQSGRLNMDASYYYRWDAWGRLTEVEDIATGTIIRQHLYDAEGRRVRTIETEASTQATTSKRLVYWGARLAATFTEGATPTKIRTYGYAGGADGESFVEVSASGAADGSYALARDFQGSILALIDRTTGAVVERYRYTVFGEVSIEDAQGAALATSAFGNDRFFLGRPFDAEVGIYDLRARWYHPESGSFLSPDPLGAVDSWNLYQYGFGTPGTWMDPNGLSVLDYVKGIAVGLGMGTWDLAKSIVGTGWDLIRHPIRTSGEIVDGFAELKDAILDGDWEALAEFLSPEAVELAKTWDDLSDYDRGRLIGKIAIEVGGLAAGGAGGVKITKKLKAAKKAVKIRKLRAMKIARRHAWDKHVVRDCHFPMIKTKEDFAKLIEDVMKKEKKNGRHGRVAFYDRENNIAVVFDPNNKDFGTAFVPTDGELWFDELFK